MIGPIDPKVLVDQGSSGGSKGVKKEKRQLTPKEQVMEDERRRQLIENAWPPLDQIAGLEVFNGKAKEGTRRMLDEARANASQPLDGSNETQETPATTPEITVGQRGEGSV